MRRIIAFAALMLVTAASTSFAAKGEFVLGGTGGASVPTGDFSDFADTGFNGGVFGDYGIANNCTIGITALYHAFNAKDKFVMAAGVDDITATVLQFTGHGRYFFPTGGQVMPFVTVGGGLYNVGVKAELMGVEADDSESNAGIYGGFGLDFKAGSMWMVGAEGTYHNIFTEDESTQVIGVNGRVSFSFAAQTN